MDYATFHQKFGGSARVKHVEERGVKLPWQTALPRGLIRLDPWELEYLYRVADACKVGILEIGRMAGGSTFMLACAAPKVPIWSIDNNPLGDESLLRYFKVHKVGANVELLIGDSALPNHSVGDLDLLFIDGDHTLEGVRFDLQTWYPKVVQGGHIILHDCCVEGVRRAVFEMLAAAPVAAIEIVVTPAVPERNWWMVPTGSLGHLIKREDHKVSGEDKNRN